MAWWLHLTNQAIQYLDILEGDPPILAAWSRRDRVMFYDLEHGTAIEDRVLHPAGQHDRTSDEWQTFLNILHAPNGVHLPILRLSSLTIYLTDDGRMRLYFDGGTRLSLENEGQETQLNTSDAERLMAVALDRFLGLSAAIDQAGRLHVFQQQIQVGVFDLGLNVVSELRPHVAISRGGSSLFVSDGRQIVLTNSGGQAIKQQPVHYDIRLMACSPDGSYLVTNDVDTGVIRVYDGYDLVLTHQRFAIDLIAEATQVQLIADPPPNFVAPTTLAIDNDGRLAFSMAGVICTTDLNFMDELPRPQTLL